MLPTQALLDATFVIDGPFGKVIGRFTGVRQDGRLCFEGWDAEEGEDWIWHPSPDVIKSALLVAHAR